MSGAMSSRWQHQLVVALMGCGVYAIAAGVDYHLWAKHSWLFYVGCLLLLVWVLIFGKTLNNTRGWLLVPGIGLVQPVELAKPATLLLLSWLGTRPMLRHTSLGAWMPTLLLSLTTLLPILLICLQPDFGTAMVFVPMTMVLIFLAGLSWRWFALGAILLLLLSPAFYTRLKPYQKDRVKVFIAPPAVASVNAVGSILPDATAKKLEQKLANFLEPASGERRYDDWNAVQSLLAVGSGGVFGKGYLRGTQHSLGYLPRTIAPTDFIFSVIAEETGFLGAGTILALLAGLVLCFCRTAMTAVDDLGVFMATGVTILFTTHIIINVSMTIQAAPIVGIPLPFLSYGGSFLLGTMFLAGLVQSVQIHRIPDTTDSQT